MSNEEPNLVLEHLRYMRRTLDRLEADMQDVKLRLGNLETNSLHHTHSFDRVNERLNRIERRLDLYDEPPPFYSPPMHPVS